MRRAVTALKVPTMTPKDPDGGPAGRGEAFLAGCWRSISAYGQAIGHEAGYPDKCLVPGRDDLAHASP